MTKLLDHALAEARRLPDDEQDAAAVALLDYIGQTMRVHLTEEQVAEVGRRLADPAPVTVPLDEVMERLKQRFG